MSIGSTERVLPSDIWESATVRHDNPPPPTPQSAQRALHPYLAHTVTYSVGCTKAHATAVVASPPLPRLFANIQAVDSI